MKKILSLLSLVLCLHLSSNAQTISYTVSEDAKGGSTFDYSVRTRSGFLILKTERSAKFMSARMTVATTLLLVDKELNTLQEIPFTVPDADYIGIHGLERMGEKCYFFYTKRKKKSDEISFCGMLINEADITKSQEFVMGTFVAEKGTPTFQLKPSLDSSAYILFVEPEQKKHDNKNFYFAVFDNKLSKLWDNNVELSVENRFIDIYGWTGKQQDKVFISYKHYDAEVNRESVIGDDGDRIPSYKANILSFKKGEAKPNVIHLNLGDKFVHSSDITFNDKTNKVIILGMYKNKHNGNINGVYYAELDPENNSINNIKKTAFNESLVELVKKDGFASKKESDPGLFIPYTGIKTIIRENGSIDYLMEYRLLTIITYSNGRSSYTVYRYKYGTIVDAYINNGNISFIRVPKYQVQDNGTNLLSFYPTMYKNKLIMLYNDDKDNAEKDLAKSPDAISNFKRAVLMAASIDENGQLSRDILMDVKSSDDFITNINHIQDIDPNTLIFTQTKMKMMSSKTRFGTMSIK